MGLSKLNNLYREVILDHADHPHNKGALKDATNAITLNNPTCGDEIDLQVKVGSDGLIDEIGYTGHGCTISQASASTGLLNGPGVNRGGRARHFQGKK